MAEMGEIRVLHVDDEPEFGETLAAFLERETDRFAVITETNASDALDRLATEDVDCVVSDYGMPGLDGLAFFERLRERGVDVPFILFTGEGSEAVASDAISLGVTDYIRKSGGPEQFRVLADEIRTVVENRRTERNESGRRLETLVSNLPGIVYRCRNEESWPMEYVDGDCVGVTGYPAAALEEGDVAWGEDVLHPDDRAEMWDAVQDALAADEPFEVVYRIVTRDGDVRWMWERGRRVEAADRDAEMLEGFITDITAGKEREQELERQRAEMQQLQELLEHALAATDTYVWEWDLRTDEVERYPDVEPLFGLSADEIGDVFTDDGFVNRVHPDDRERVEEQIRRGVESGEGYQIECRFVSDDRSWWVRDRAEVITDETGEPVRAVGSVTDITELRERERELERKNERLDEFASIVSHDLRNPLNLAIGRLGFAREESGPDDEHLATVADALDRMERIVEETLALARQGKTVSEPEWVAVDTVGRASWRQVDTADATLQFDDSFRLRCDPDRLRHLFENLFHNSVEHDATDNRSAPDDSVERVASTDGTADSITVRVGRLDGGFYVADDGPGIPPDERETVFEPGYTTAEDGTGFGLSIVRRIADAHGWTVRVTESREGGARFEFVDADIRT
jgi:PAS domain S-box-containing protein